MPTRGPDKHPRKRRTNTELGKASKGSMPGYNVTVSAEDYLDVRDLSETTGLPIRRIVSDAIRHYRNAPEVEALLAMRNPEPRPLDATGTAVDTLIREKGPYGAPGSPKWQEQVGLYEDTPRTREEQDRIIEQARINGFDMWGEPLPA